MQSSPSGCHLRALLSSEKPAPGIGHDLGLGTKIQEEFSDVQRFASFGKLRHAVPRRI